MVRQISIAVVNKTCMPVTCVHACTLYIGHRLGSSDRTAFKDYTGPDLLCSTVFHF